MPPIETISSVLLLASIPDLSPPQFLSPVIVEAATTSHDHLYIVLFSPLFNEGAISHTQSWKDVQRLLTFVYVQAAKVAQDMDKIPMQINVLLQGLDCALPDQVSVCDIVYRVSGDLALLPLPLALLEAPHRYMSVDRGTASDLDLGITPGAHDTSSVIPVVALGGTFDHLHAGHKILLSTAAWLTKDKMIVGVTDDVLLSSKAHPQVLESLEMRKANVRSFLELFKPGRVEQRIEYDIVTITDVYGPTGWDPNIQALVVSRETMSGAEKITQLRQEKALPGLAIFEIDVISHNSPNEEDLKLKMSSTFIRKWIMERQEQPQGEHKEQESGSEGRIKQVERGEAGWIGPQDA